MGQRKFMVCKKCQKEKSIEFYTHHTNLYKGIRKNYIKKPVKNVMPIEEKLITGKILKNLEKLLVKGASIEKVL